MVLNTRRISEFIAYTILIVVYACFKYVQGATEVVDGGEKHEVVRYQVAQFNFEHVSDVYAITLWILLGSLAKVGFHLSKKLTEKFPESCLLIILGLIVGALLYATKLAEQKAYVLNSDTFLLFLLPPIILEAGYFMPNRPFFDNVGTILLFAIVNTLFNTLCIGGTIYAFNFTPFYGGTQFEMLHCFVFAALISAVDPVAVLATFVEIHVNDMLYIIVFGESLLNDAVSVVLYRMFDKFAEMGQENIVVADLLLGTASFIYVAIVGVLIGIIFGAVACFTTKFTEHTPILEPLIILTYSYLSYLTAEMFSTSGILAITFCGMFMKQYVGYNIAKKSNATIEYVLKMLASIMETIIFMFMGLSTISDNHSWNTGFVIITIIACTVYRMIGVLVFANIANRWRLLELKFTDMLIMSYGGIRGAVAFALALILDESRVPRKKEFVTATIAVVFFTVFIQGTTIGPVVKYLRIKQKEEEEPTISAKLTNRLIDHVMSFFEETTGVAGKHKLRYRVRNLDRKYMKKLLLREKLMSKDQNLLAKFNQIKELNITRLAEKDNDFTGLAPTPSMANMRNMSISNFLGSGLNESPTVPDFQILNSQRSEKVDEDSRFGHLLDTAMYSARRRHTIHNRSQLNEDLPEPSSKPNMFHHQNPFAARNLYELDYKAKERLMKRRINAANAAQRAHSLNRTAAEKPFVKPEVKISNEKKSPPALSIIEKPLKIVIENESSSLSVLDMEQSPDSPNIIPPPWKLNYGNNEPVRAHIPAWANNPDYTLHATTTKKDDTQYVPVFDVFNADRRIDEESGSSTELKEKPASRSKSADPRSSSSTRL